MEELTLYYITYSFVRNDAQGGEWETRGFCGGGTVGEKEHYFRIKEDAEREKERLEKEASEKQYADGVSEEWSYTVRSKVIRIA